MTTPDLPTRLSALTAPEMPFRLSVHEVVRDWETFITGLMWGVSEKNPSERSRAAYIDRALRLLEKLEKLNKTAA